VTSIPVPRPRALDVNTTPEFQETVARLRSQLQEEEGDDVES
jgi:hypothetical protein